MLVISEANLPDDLQRLIELRRLAYLDPTAGCRNDACYADVSAADYDAHTAKIFAKAVQSGCILIARLNGEIVGEAVWSQPRYGELRVPKDTATFSVEAQEATTPWPKGTDVEAWKSFYPPLYAMVAACPQPAYRMLAMFRCEPVLY